MGISKRTHFLAVCWKLCQTVFFVLRNTSGIVRTVLLFFEIRLGFLSWIISNTLARS